MSKDDFSGIGEVIRKASEAFADTLSAVNKAVMDFGAQAGASADREQMVETWLRSGAPQRRGQRGKARHQSDGGVGGELAQGDRGVRRLG